MKIPYWNTEFGVMVRDNYVCVDKTALIYKIAYLCSIKAIEQTNSKQQ